jgi:pimeloyl-ACP methyl ester carboxylesterase
MLLSLLKSALIMYALLCVGLYLMQSRMIYLGGGTRVDVKETDFAFARDGVTLRGWRVNPGQPRALLYFGGNGEAIEYQLEDFARWFPDYTLYLVAYRGYGASEGAPGEQALKGDALALYDLVAKEHSEVAVLGRSLGTGIGVYLAAERPVAKLALITPYDSLAAVAAGHYPILPVRWLLHERFDSLEEAPRIKATVLLLIARHDEVIPPARAEHLATAFTSPPRIQWLEAMHNTVDADARLQLALREFFRP